MRRKEHQKTGDRITYRVRVVFDDYGVWLPDLLEAAVVGYPRGGGAGGRSSEHGDPTATAALSPDEVRTVRKEHERDMQTLVDLIGRLEKRRVWVRAKGLPSSVPGPVICENVACGAPISGRGSDVQRDGLCPRCYQHRRRHGLAWPTRYMTADEAVVMRGK